MHVFSSTPQSFCYNFNTKIHTDISSSDYLRAFRVLSNGVRYDYFIARFNVVIFIKNRTKNTLRNLPLRGAKFKFGKW
jgi:hypothetical protein